MQDHLPSKQAWTHAVRADIAADAPSVISAKQTNGATFDTHHADSQTNLSGLKKLQDPAKFGKARFSFRLYKK